MNSYKIGENTFSKPIYEGYTHQSTVKNSDDQQSSHIFSLPKGTRHDSLRDSQNIKYGLHHSESKTIEQQQISNVLDNQLSTISKMGITTEKFKLDRVEIPFKKQYEITFQDQDSFKVEIDAQSDALNILLTSQSDMKMWKGDYYSEQIEDISRKTGRELTYQQFIETLNEALTCLDTYKEKEHLTQQKKHLFVDLLCYQDLQLLRQGKDSMKNASANSQNIDPQKQKKRYLILTYFEKFNMNDTSDILETSIKEEIEVENEKTHYPLPLQMVEITSVIDLKESRISKAALRKMIRNMGDALSMNQSFIQLQTQSSGFGLGKDGSNSILNHTIKSDFKHDATTSQGPSNYSRASNFRTARQFFSKDNFNHPSIEENKKLKEHLKHLQQVREQTKQSLSTVSQQDIDEQITSIKMQLESYKQVFQTEKERLLRDKDEIQSQIVQSKTQLESQFGQSQTSGFSINTTDNIDDVRRQLGEISIQLEENKENYKKNASKKQKEIEAQFQDIEQHRAEERKLRVKVNQLENDLLHQIKRLDIICKSKGLPRPKKDHLLQNKSPQIPSRTYVSSYNRTRVSPGLANNSGSRVNQYGRVNNRLGSNNSNGSYNKPNVAIRTGSDAKSQDKRLSNKFFNPNYTPPNRNNQNRSPSVGSNVGSNRGYSPNGVQLSNQNNRMRRNVIGSGGKTGGTQMRSPSNASDGSKKTIKSSGYGKVTTSNKQQYNRLYSPNGTQRNSANSGANSGQNRIRREGAVTGSMNANNNQNREPSRNGSANPGIVRNSSRKSIRSVNSRRQPQKSDRSVSDKSDNSNRRIEPHKNMMSVAKNSKFVMNTRTIIKRPELQDKRDNQYSSILKSNMMEGNQQDSSQNIDQKINQLQNQFQNLLQNLLKMAKGK